MPQLDYTTFASQLFWLVLTFFTLYMLLSQKALPAIRDVLQARQDRISHDLEKAELALAEAEEAKINYTQSLEQAHRNAQDRLAATMTAVKKESAVRHAALDSKLAAQSEEAEQRIAVIKNDVTKELQPVSQMLAELINAKIMDSQFSTDLIKSVIGTKG